MSANLLRKLSKGKTPIWLLRFISRFWGPFRGAGIYIDHISDDYRTVKVRLKKRWLNTNYVGTQFGGSMYAMTDPFYMLMIINNIGDNFVVWDKFATIRYKKPGRTDLFANFELSQQEIDDIVTTIKEHNKMDWQKDILVKDTDGDVVAVIVKTIYIADKQYYKDLKET